MNHTQSAVTFELQITETADSTWYGALRVGGQLITFQSELELLQAITALLGSSQGPSCRWNAPE